MMLAMRHGNEPKIICFALFISVGSSPALLGWLEWERCGKGEWKQIDIGYGVGVVEENMYHAECMGIQTGEKIPVSLTYWGQHDCPE